MTMKTYARIEGSTVLELLKTSADISTLFHAKLRWVEVTDPAVKVGWVRNGATFVAPSTTGAGSASAASTAPTLAMLHAQLNVIATQLAALQAAATHA